MTITSFDDSVEIALGSNAETKVKILNYGATVLSWKINGKEQLWLSEASKLDGSRAVRGGIPLVFPRFGPASGNHPATDKLPQHGFARSVTWELLGQVDDHTVQFGLGPEQLPQDLAAAWTYDFTLIYTVQLLEDSLKISLDVKNPGKEAFDFNVLFHTYFAVPEVEKITVAGLNKLAFFDKVASAQVASDSEKEVTFSSETDRVYKNSPAQVAIKDGSKTLFTVEASNLKDTVVWNPWTEKANEMSDWAPKDGFHQMVCVESGVVAEFAKLAADSSWTGSVTLKAHI